jgi:hypothetical protein
MPLEEAIVDRSRKLKSHGEARVFNLPNPAGGERRVPVKRMASLEHSLIGWLSA